MQHFRQNAMGHFTRGGYLPGPSQGGYPGGGWGYPKWGVNLAGGTKRAGGYPGQVPPQPGQDGGIPSYFQHREYLLHGRRYASCVHAGGLSCLPMR